ncbi:MAG: ubiquinol oxidase subunit II [Rhizobiales bacterium]|nr:ubiquinol oxidase subunit II [Hyphomicrobiales bacterium]
MLSGCGLSDAPIISPKGPIALAERDLLFTATAVMLLVIIPVIVMTFLFAWRYRASNMKARYAPNWSFSIPLEATVWLIPAAIVMALGHLLWNATHKLDPYKRLDSAAAPFEVQVVAQDWKWLFIYPEQRIASVNELAFPSGRPLSLKITSDTVMNSFFIPALGGQIYAMAGMQARLHLLADQPGRFTGRNTQYSGDGFADQHFEAIAASKPDFENWIAKVRQSQDTLDAAAYRALAAPSIAHPVTYYSSVAPNLFETILAKYRGHKARDHQQAAEAANRKF